MKSNLFIFIFLFIGILHLSAQKNVFAYSGPGYDDPNLYYFPLISSIENNCDMQLTTQETFPVASDLIGMDVVIIAAPDDEFDDSHAQEILNVLNRGGVLFVIGEWQVFDLFNGRIDRLLDKIGSSMRNARDIYDTFCGGLEGPLDIIDSNLCIMQDIDFWYGQVTSRIVGNGIPILSAGNGTAFAMEYLRNGVVYYIGDVNWMEAEGCEEQLDNATQMLTNMICICNSEDLCRFIPEVVYPRFDPVARECEQVCLRFSYLNRRDLDSVVVQIELDSSSTATLGEDFDVFPNSINMAHIDNIEVCIDILADDVFEGQEFINLNIKDPCTGSNLSRSIEIRDPQTFQGALSGASSGCDGELASYSVNLFGGSSPFQYLWSTGDTTADISFIIDTTFSIGVTVTDACGEQIILQRNIISDCCEEPLIYYDFDDCNASSGETAIYDEFQPQLLCQLDCDGLTSKPVFRDNASQNRHSCTMGNEGSAMCVAALDACEYDSDSDKSVVFEFFIRPLFENFVELTMLSFNEMAPVMFDWIDGDSGPNNFPTLYGVNISIVETGELLFEEYDIPTSNEWTLEEFQFDSVRIEAPSTVRVEILPYCLTDNGASVQAWDIDDLAIYAKCISSRPFEGSLNGNVSRFDHHIIPDVDLILHNVHSGDIKIAQNDLFGKYSFTNVSFDAQYEIIPDYQDDYRTGISTYDIIQIQKHLLGIKEFNSPYQHIAADVNGSQSVTALDMVMLRKLILGKIDQLAVDSWQFVENNARISIQSPYNFQGKISIDDFHQNQSNLDFSAVKSGDLNLSSVYSRFMTNGVHELSEINQDVDISVRDRTANPYEKFNHRTLEYSFESAEDHNLIHFYASDIHALEGLQFALQDLNVMEVISGAIEVNSKNYYRSKNHWNFSWNSEIKHDMSESTRLFSLKTSNHMSQLILANHLKAEAYADEIYSLDFRARNTDLSKSINSVSVIPNPFSENAVLQLNVVKDGVHTLNIISTTGNLIYSKNMNLDRGRHQVELNKDKLGLSKGMYIVQLQNGLIQQNLKMIIQ